VLILAEVRLAVEARESVGGRDFVCRQAVVVGLLIDRARTAGIWSTVGRHVRDRMRGERQRPEAVLSNAPSDPGRLIRGDVAQPEDALDPGSDRGRHRRSLAVAVGDATTGGPHPLQRDRERPLHLIGGAADRKREPVGRHGPHRQPLLLQCAAHSRKVGFGGPEAMTELLHREIVTVLRAARRRDRLGKPREGERVSRCHGDVETQMGAPVCAPDHARVAGEWVDPPHAHPRRRGQRRRRAETGERCRRSDRDRESQKTSA
jgi:hypothetical protein